MQSSRMIQMGPISTTEQDGSHGVDSLEDFFDNAAIALHVVAGDGTILRANKAELELLGYAADEYVGRHIAEFHADAPVIADILTRLARGETIRRYPARLRARDGSIKHVEITSSGRSVDGRLRHTRCFTFDVTDRVQARADARRKDDQLRQVLDAIPAAIFMVDAAGKLTYVNPAARELAPREPAIGEDDWYTTFPLFTPGGVEIRRAQRPMSTALRENRPVWGTETLAKRRDGSFVPVITFTTPIRDDSGELIGAVNMFVDISEKKQAEEMVRLAFEAAPSGLIGVDVDGRIVLANAEAEQLFGYSRSELLGQPVEKMIPPRLRKDHADHRKGYLKRPEVRAMGAGRDLLARRKDGSEIPVEVGLSYVRTSRGLIIVSTVNDISERQRTAERETLLVRELRHRSSNMFAVTQAIVTLSLSGDPRLDQVQQVLVSRLQAMERIHGMLSDADWKGLDLNDIVRAELEPFAGRVEIDGDETVLGPRTAQDFSLGLHELTTNAVKYGALSVPEGRVEVSWSAVTGERPPLLQFRWRERDGPPVIAPSHEGFGSLLLRSVFPGSCLDYAPEGVRFRIELPLGEPSPGDEHI